MPGQVRRFGQPEIGSVWNSHGSSGGCSHEALARSHGAGLFYCFAINENRLLWHGQLASLRPTKRQAFGAVGMIAWARFSDRTEDRIETTAAASFLVGLGLVISVMVQTASIISITYRMCEINVLSP
jgi:hypothetical protein